MKKIFFLLTTISTFTACKSKTESSDSTNLAPLADSANHNNVMSDTPRNSNTVVLPKDSVVTTKTVTVTKIPVEHKTPADHKNPNPVTPVNTSTTTSTNNSGTSPATGTPAPVATAPAAAPQPEKKGLPKSAKGAIIGAGAGAVTGGIIGKNAKGAIIGGAVGSAAGYILGRRQDKKDGRVGKKDSL